MAARLRLPMRIGAGGGLSATAFSALGYFVLQPNPRGSYGQGEEFTQANRKDFGYGDLRDILAGVDAVRRSTPSTRTAWASPAGATADS
jgi:dipeptidyl aminopeptidase/acylaminoacyl peptidase